MSQSFIFRRFVGGVWDAPNQDTREYEDANETAATMGAQPTHDNTGPTDEDFVTWLFPDGSTIQISRNGHGLGA